MPEQSLRAIQRAMQQCLTHGDEQIRSLIVGTPTFSIETRLGIYTEAYRLRLIEALSDAYPAVHTLLGDKGFHTLATAYIHHHPSHFRSIRWFGDRLASFLAEQSTWKDTPLLAEMARFEWSLRGAFDAADFTPVTTQALHGIPPEHWARLRLAFSPALQEPCYFEWNTVRLWQAIDAESDPIPPERLAQPETWLIWRNTDQQTQFRSLLVDEAWAMNNMRQGQDFAVICNGLSEWLSEEHIAARAAGFLHQWLDDELIVAIETGAIPPT